ncbi:MAG TPA: site-specific integrase, partial [Chloroflexota bacterium]|nr:site-specific integrase [Chloroflexota bacterium]
MASTHRRRHGEGSIYKRADGRWVGAVSLDDGTRKVIYGKTRVDVQASVVDTLKKQQDGLPIHRNERQTLGQFLRT